jgi:DNA-directed RNA polymerase specialized sigma24 family protein
MTLVQAFRLCAPLVGDATVDGPRREAMGVLYVQLEALAAGDARLEDAPAVVLGRIQQNGPHTDDRFDTDASVERYLRRALRNFRIDGERDRSRRDSLDEQGPGSPDVVGGRRSPERQPEDVSRAGRELARAFERLLGEILPACKEGTAAEVALRRRVAEGRATFDDCVREASGEVTKKTRDAFYQRQHRAMRDLAGAVEAHIADRRLTGWAAEALRVVLGEMKDAEAGWPIGGGA